MRMVASGDHVELTSDLRDHIDRCLYFSIGRFGPAIQSVDVRVGEANGHRGGIDKHCRIIVKLRGNGAPQITLDEHDANVYGAVAQAATRLGRTVARTLHRKRQRRTYQRRREASGRSAGNSDDGQVSPMTGTQE